MATSANRRCPADARTNDAIVATRCTGSVAFTDQIARLITGASAAGSPLVRTTSVCTLSIHHHCPSAT